MNRALSFNQLHGFHRLGLLNDAVVDWQANYSRVDRSQPDTRDVTIADSTRVLTRGGWRMGHTPGKRTAAIACAGMALLLAFPASTIAQSPSTAPAPVITPEPAKDCARSDDPGAMQMWERSGGNKGMVDQLVCDWNTANPDKPINLSYIPHVEMVGKIARGIASKLT